MTMELRAPRFRSLVLVVHLLPRASLLVEPDAVHLHPFTP
jgi:hypothetical protein